MKKNELKRVSHAARFVFLIFSLPLIYAFELHADKAPIAYNSFDGVPTGAKAMGMGFAFSSVADDASTIYYNPAGLATLDKSYLSASYEIGRYSSLPNEQAFSSSPIQTSGFQFLALTSGKGAISFRPLSDMTVHTANGNNWTTTQSQINAYSLSAARKGEDGIFAGLNINYLSGTIAQSSMVNNVPSALITNGRGISLDIGFLYEIAKYATAGINFQNLLGTMWWDNYDKQQLPFGIKGGLSFKLTGNSLLAVDLGKQYYRNENPGPDETVTHIGFEQALSGAMRLRLGAYGPDLKNQDTTSLTYGLGFDLSGYKISLAGEQYKVSGTGVNRYVMSLDLPI